MAKMKRYEECHERARYMVRNYKFFTSVNKTKFDADLSLVMGKTGPNRSHNGVLVELRKAIKDAKRATNKSEGEIIVEACQTVSNKTIGGWWNSSDYDLEDRVAAIKMLRHLYLVRAAGGQEVWVYSPPVKYTEWVFDELNGFANTGGLKVWSSLDDETYSEADKQALGDCVQKATSWASICVTKLASPDAATKAIAKHWFCDSAADDAAVTKTCASLHSGFKRILAVLKSNKLVLSDEPIDRNGGGWKDYAFVYKFEKMSVIYMQGASLKAAKGTKMWLAALTVIHELSHREVDTDDHRYDSSGKLAPSAGALTAAKALDNADNWGYFAADINGELTAGTKNTVST